MKHLMLALLLCPAMSLANPVANSVERQIDRKQLSTDAATIDRDRGEIRSFRALLQKLDAAIAASDVAAARTVKKKLTASMDREIGQSNSKTALAKVEVAQSKGEVRGDTREVRRDVVLGKPVQAIDDRRDRRDDQRDLADDRDDLSEQRTRRARQQAILAEFQAIQIKGDDHPWRSLNAKRSLLDEFETTMVRDMGENWEELHEDRGELREDRSETKEDRRQR
ncbi:MAG: hypothetical protein ACI9MC_001793 [Kiritimatiellia bacterium]|jgi:hypothetical protein